MEFNSGVISIKSRCKGRYKKVIQEGKGEKFLSPLDIHRPCGNKSLKYVRFIFGIPLVSFLLLFCHLLFSL